MTILELTDDDARAFLEWRAHQRNFELLVASGVMAIKEGSFEAHFDQYGRIGAIKAHVNVYKHDPDAPVIVIHTPEVDKLAPQS